MRIDKSHAPTLQLLCQCLHKIIMMAATNSTLFSFSFMAQKTGFKADTFRIFNASSLTPIWLRPFSMKSTSGSSAKLVEATFSVN